MFKHRSGGLDVLINRPQPSLWERFLASPLTYSARQLYSLQRPPQPANKGNEKAITVVCISDTHNSQPVIPHGDLLIHAGDLTQSGTVEEIQAALNWLKNFSHPNKIVIAGTHDIALDSIEEDDFRWDGIQYLRDSSTTIQFSNGRSVNVFGSPWTRTPGTWAFHHSPDRDMWTGKVPDDTDILVTHEPPRFHLDGDCYGDGNLLEELWRVRPRLHVFGHIHSGYGIDLLVYDQFERWYETVLRRPKGLLALIWTFIKFVELRCRGTSASGTQLVNAAIVGGLRDEKRRDPIVLML